MRWNIHPLGSLGDFTELEFLLQGDNNNNNNNNNNELMKCVSCGSKGQHK